MDITRDQALCMFLYKEFTTDNVKYCKERIKSWEDVDICYNTYLNEPIVVPNLRILGDPFTYKKYRVCQDPSTIEQIRKENVFELIKDLGFSTAVFDSNYDYEFFILETYAQVKLFLNEAFRHENPNNSKVYELKLLTTKEILESIKEYTSLFSNRTAQSFSRWCSANDDLLLAICDYLPKYKASISNLKENGYEIIGYARKSPSSEINMETRLKLLQRMIDNLRDRSVVDKTYVSVSYMLEYLQSVDHNVCLVSIDYAGLSSHSHLIKGLLEDYPVIKKIAIETFSFDNKIQLFDSDRLQSDDQLLENFDCRKKLVQRSL
ncbi:hypothetical protein BDC45DRAFT_571992 [Circinella umbellata]|nr:hypothetical protein BDC45DRAFT_571992 [Circinella umbellata]